MLNNIMNRIESLREMSLAEIIETNYFVKENINDLGFMFIRNSELLGCYGIAITGLVLLTIEGVDDYVPAIIMDNDFEELSDNTKRFIIAHELGHYNHHISKITNPNYVRDINDEFEADEYAASKVGFQSAVFALEELQDKLDEISCGMNIAGIEEVEKRIENILSKSMVTC